MNYNSVQTLGFFCLKIYESEAGKPNYDAHCCSLLLYTEYAHKRSGKPLFNPVEYSWLSVN